MNMKRNRQVLYLLAATLLVCGLPLSANATGIITSVNSGGGPVLTASGVNSTNLNNQTGAVVSALYNTPSGAFGEVVSVPSPGTSVQSGLGYWGLNIVGGADYQLTAQSFPAFTGILWMEIDLFPAGGAFDIDSLAPSLPPGSTGTPGSLGGIPPQLLSFTGIWDIALTFSNPIAIGAALPVGDLYGKMRIDFSSPFDANDFMELRIDTDTLISSVPEPATLLLLGAGLAGLAGWRWRKNRSAAD